MNLQTNMSPPDEDKLLEEKNIFGFSWANILIALALNTIIILLINFSRLTQVGLNPIELFKLDLSFPDGLSQYHFELLVSNGILLLGFLLIKFIKKPVALIIFQLFCGFAIFGLYYSRLADDYFYNAQHVVTSVILVLTAIISTKVIQIIKTGIPFNLLIRRWVLVLMFLNILFLAVLLIFPTKTPFIFKFFEYNRLAQGKIDMRKIVPESEFYDFDITYTESRESDKFQYADFSADLKQNNVDRYATWATVEVMILRKVDTRYETMGNKIQLKPSITAYYNCSCSSSECFNRKEKGQTKGESDQQCSISWRNGIYRLQVGTTHATLDKFLQMAKTVAQNSEYLK